VTEKNPGFDPTVVAQFFRTLEEFRSGQADFQRNMLGTVNSLRDEFRELRKEIQEIRKELAEGNRIFGVQEQQIKTMQEWTEKKAAECLRHQTLTTNITEEIHSLRMDMEHMKAVGSGLSLAWKIIAGVALLVSTVTGVLVAISRLQQG
jgi:hypothetical protein